ncbi:MAG: recombination mediator RecR [Myxococcales bacterium]|jgi:recombination protein RecR|nr:recombination mediator RecR [Myxococcales bacterium]
MTPAPLQRLIVELARLPGIGEKTAQRLAFHILRAPEAYARGLSTAITEVVERVRLCPVCCALTETDDCPQCGDPRRDGRLICVVENIADMLAIEKTREFNGRYHVLHGVLSPLDGVGPDQLHIKELIARLAGGVEEVIVATNPDVEGEVTSLYLTKLIRPLGIRVTRIAQGVPMGGDLEFADQVTLARALTGRQEIG